jgi:hypothetical protein
MIEEVFMGITYTYFLDIIEKNSISTNSDKGVESYIYTARMNEVILAQMPMVYFKYSYFHIDMRLILWLFYWFLLASLGTLYLLI